MQRVSGLSSPIVWILLPLAWLAPGLFGQSQAEAEQAVRARVTEFLQYHVEGNFRKAYDMVAEDTKDYYFSTGKVQLKAFKVGDIKLTDNFTKATVSATISKTVNVAGTDLPVDMPSTTTWKVENGKWVWYKEKEPESGLAALLGIPTQANPSAAAPVANPNADADLPKNLNDQAVAAAAKSILQQVSVDKKEITLSADKPSEDQVVFHNGLTGSVQLQVASPEIPGFIVKLEQTIARASADVPVVFRYEPGDQGGPQGPIAVQIMVQPLNQVFQIRVNFSAPK